MITQDERILEIRDLSVNYKSGERTINAVRHVSLELNAGETLGIVGESGSGKSTLAFAVMGYLGSQGHITDGTILFRGTDLNDVRGKARRELLGARIAMVYQDPQASLNPSIRIGEQLAETLRAHRTLSRQAVQARVLELLNAVHLPDSQGVALSYPHQLSGGMQQRVVIAMALALDPDLLILDEPTTGLDVTTEAHILDLVNELKTQFHSAILYITHNLGVVARVCDRVAVMYAGEIVESNSVERIFEHQTHPYTLDLLQCVPRLGTHHRQGSLHAIPGHVPRTPQELPRGCVYAPRCSFARPRCLQERPPLVSISSQHQTACFFWNELTPAATPALTPSAVVRGRDGEELAAERVTEGAPLLEVGHVTKIFDERTRRFFLAGPLEGREVRAVNDVSIQLGTDETLALVGESGCGKTTLSRCIVGLAAPTQGTMQFQETDITREVSHRPAPVRQALQIVFQNPDSSLNPRHTISQIIGRPLELFHHLSGDELRLRVIELLELVKLDASYLDRYPTQLSGGEKQRVAIARAFAGSPSLVICDEAVSALDVSVQASILNLLVKLQQEQSTSFLFVSHDLGVVQYVADRIAVMYLGEIVETGTVEQIFAPPYHPYTEALLSAIPIPDPHIKQEQIRLEGAVPSAAQHVSGCPFHTRCPRKYGAVCETELPPWQEAGTQHWIRCHIPLQELRALPSAMERLGQT